MLSLGTVVRSGDGTVTDPVGTLPDR
jgi:hypothetical protein